jgi:hypothetical protein
MEHGIPGSSGHVNDLARALDGDHHDQSGCSGSYGPLVAAPVLDGSVCVALFTGTSGSRALAIAFANAASPSAPARVDQPAPSGRHGRAYCAQAGRGTQPNYRQRCALGNAAQPRCHSREAGCRTRGRRGPYAAGARETSELPPVSPIAMPPEHNRVTGCDYLVDDHSHFRERGTVHAHAALEPLRAAERTQLNRS